MKKTIIVLLLVFLVAAPARACDAGTMNISVNGMVCDFCARSLEKLFGKREEISGITVDLDAGLVAVQMKAGRTIDDATIKQLITDAGYNVTGIARGCAKGAGHG